MSVTIRCEPIRGHRGAGKWHKLEKAPRLGIECLGQWLGSDWLFGTTRCSAENAAKNGWRYIAPHHSTERREPVEGVRRSAVISKDDSKERFEALHDEYKQMFTGDNKEQGDSHV